MGECGVSPTDIEDYALHVHEVMDGLEGFHNDGMLTVSLPVEHVGKGNADEAAVCDTPISPNPSVFPDEFSRILRKKDLLPVV